jgi:hypothetical protein
MMNFVQQQEDLYDFDDQSLANELQSGMRGYHPMVVAAEIQRRLKERGEAQQQMMAQQAQQNQPVAQRQLMEFMAQAQPAEMAPEMMPPEMAMQGGAEGMPPEMMAAAMPPQMPAEMPAEMPVGIAAGMPQQMAGGGSIRRAQAGFRGSYQDPLGQLVGESMTAAGRGTAGVFRGIGAAGMATPGYSALFSGYGSSSEEERLRRAIAAREQIGLDTSSLKAELNKIIESRKPAAQRTSVQTGYGSEGVSADEVPSIARRPGTDYSGATTTADRGLTSLPTYSPTSFDFGSAYERNLGDLQLQPVTIRSPRATEQSVRDASFFAEEMGRLGKFSPDKERFQRESQSDLLVGLGSVIAGATQRGDIAKGLAQLAAQQREARRGFRQEEREYAGLEAALRREERGERQAERRERRQIEREEAASEAALRQEARQMTALEMEAQSKIDDANYKIQNLTQQLEIAQAKAEREGTNAQLKLLMDTITMQLRQAQTEKARAETAKIRAEAAAAERFGGTSSTPAAQVFAQ